MFAVCDVNGWETVREWGMPHISWARQLKAGTQLSCGTTHCHKAVMLASEKNAAGVDRRDLSSSVAYFTHLPNQKLPNNAEREITSSYLAL